jgi:predicted nucleic acid-binding protein
MTVLPVKPPIPAEQALLFIEEIRSRLTPIGLTPADYFETLQATGDLGFKGGSIYDALHLRCARQCEAKTIYTWNLKHFQAIAPDLANAIRTP